MRLVKHGLEEYEFEEIEDVLVEEMEVSHFGKEFGWWFEQDIDGENEDDNDNKSVMVNKEGYMRKCHHKTMYRKVKDTEKRPDIAFVVEKLSRYISNPETQHWQAIQRVLEYLKKTMDCRFVYSVYPSVVEGYTDAS
nr:zinc finger, CCHC-type [Tanacetum cinerariifolium]